MKTFTLSAGKIYLISKQAFFALLPNCEVNFTHGSQQMWFNLCTVARDGKKTQRIESTALILTYAPDDKIESFKAWLNDYFSEEMQEEIFGLKLSDTLDIIPGNSLEKAIHKLNRKR
ncbi:MAG: hypothetical protein ACI4SF_00630 [Oscillospiraceae bacterium]